MQRKQNFTYKNYSDNLHIKYINHLNKVYCNITVTSKLLTFKNSSLSLHNPLDNAKVTTLTNLYKYIYICIYVSTVFKVTKRRRKLRKYTRMYKIKPFIVRKLLKLENKKYNSFL